MYDRISHDISRPGRFSSGKAQYDAMTAAAQRCDAAAAALARIPVKAFAAQPVAQEHMAALQEYTAAQNALFGAVRAFAQKKKATPFLISLMNQAQFRASEALNLVASLQLEARKSDASPEDKALREGMAERFADMGEKAGVFAGMRRVSPAMHGHALLNEISVQAQAMFSALDALERNTGMSPAAFTAAADGLKRQVEALKSRMDAPGVNSGMIQEDAGLREALSGLLRRASERLEGLHQIEARREVSAAVSDLLPEIDPEQLDVLAGVMPFSNLSALVQGLKPSVALYNDELRTLKQQVEAGQITDAQFKAGMISAAGHLRTGSARESIEVLQMLSILSRSDIRTIEEFQYEYEDYSGVMLDTNTARIFMTFLKSDTFMKGEVAALMDKLVTSPMAHADVLDAQMDDIVAMKNMFDSGRMVLRGEYVSAALERHVDMPTVLEASLRGIPADQLEMRASDALRTGARVLGQGVGSTVQLCTYRGEGGEEVSLVFKPEVGARQSLAQLCAGQLGFGTELRVMQLNVAACRSADAIGCGDVVARSSIGMNEGRLGLFMEVAPGRSAADISDGKPCAVTSDGREISFAEALGRLDSKGLRGHMLGNLMRELSRLEWADLLSGQSDRHMGNYLVYINADTGDVKVTGIDNDASFSRRRVGATTVDITGEPGLHGALQASGVTFPRMLVDVQKLSAGQREALVNGMGALLFSGAGTAWNVDKVPGQREALQRAGLSLPPMTVEVGSLG